MHRHCVKYCPAVTTANYINVSETVYENLFQKLIYSLTEATVLVLRVRSCRRMCVNCNKTAKPTTTTTTTAVS